MKSSALILSVLMAIFIVPSCKGSKCEKYYDKVAACDTMGQFHLSKETFVENCKERASDAELECVNEPNCARFFNCVRLYL